MDKILAIQLTVKYNHGMDFRKILASKPKGLKPRLCMSKSSPTCLFNFIKSRIGQKMCLNCLIYNDLLDAHPIIEQD